ncbi:MAG: TIGR00304 family membrane protein [Candidatus Asgardarchaeia archaeon]
MELSLFGILFIIIGIIIITYAIILMFMPENNKSSALSERTALERESYTTEKKQVKKKFAGVIFIGPIPIVIASDKRTGALALVIGVLLFIAILILTLSLGWI